MRRGYDEPSATAGDRTPRPGAEAAQAGYEYQLDVSVLAAIRLLLVTNAAERMTLEPMNEEDLQADLLPSAPGRVMPAAGLFSGRKLIVQVKFTGGEPWSLNDLVALLSHGKDRKPAKDLLEDLDVQYLLVTNAHAKGDARKLLVDDFEEASDPRSFPKSLDKTLPRSPQGRVAILGGLDQRRIDLELRDMLGHLRVPHSRQSECRDDLRKEARRRMRGSVAGVWTRKDLLGNIRAHDGQLASAAELEAFVPPANFKTMTTMLRERNAIVIKGPSGTGKTVAALALCDAARKLDGSTDVVVVDFRHGPGQSVEPGEPRPEALLHRGPMGPVQP